VLAPWAHGRGFATEAMRAVLDWGATRFGDGQRTVCLIAPENAASIHVAERLGEGFLRHDDTEDEPAVIYGIERPRS